LANYLISNGVKQTDLIPVCMDRSIELVTGILAILKAGATYVPIDAAYPPERIHYMLEDTEAKILLTSKDLAISFSNKANIKLLYADDPSIKKFPSTKPGINIEANQVACIIYTSGSSGRPKGVLLGHAGIVNRLEWMWETYPFEQNEKNAIKTSIGFVDHIWELFGALNRGVASVLFRRKPCSIWTSW
jgi:non-ribosomal peptide synthetase component F